MDKFDYIREQLEQRFDDLEELGVILRNKCLCAFLEWSKANYHNYADLIEESDTTSMMREWVSCDKHRGEYGRKYNDVSLNVGYVNV